MNNFIARKGVFYVLAISGVSALSNAGTNDKYFYIGSELSVNHYDASHSVYDNLSPTEETRSLSLLFGYQINQEVGLQGSYAYDFSGIKKMSLELVKSEPLSEQWGVYGRVGVANIDYSKHNEFVPSFGAGVSYQPIAPLTFNIGTMLLPTQDFSDIESLGLNIGITYKIGVIVDDKQVSIRPYSITGKDNYEPEMEKSVDAQAIDKQDQIIIEFEFAQTQGDVDDINIASVEDIHQIHLNGYTDQIGSDSFNYKLGLQRAAWVAEQLINLGVDKKLITIKSNGKAKKDSDHPMRRVEIDIQYK